MTPQSPACPITPQQWLEFFAAQEKASALAAIFAEFPETEWIPDHATTTPALVRRS